MKRPLLPLLVLAILLVCIAVLLNKRPAERRGALEAEPASGNGSDQPRAHPGAGGRISASGPTADEETGAAHLIRWPNLKQGERRVPGAFSQRTLPRKPAKLIIRVPIAQKPFGGRSRMSLRIRRKNRADLIAQLTKPAVPSGRARSAAAPVKSQGLAGRITPGDGQDLSDARVQGPVYTSSPAPEVRAEITPAPAKTPAAEAGSESGSLSTPSPSPTTFCERRLTPPLPIEQPPLHPLLRTTVASGALGMAGLQEQTVRGRLRVRLFVRADGFVVRVDVILPSGDLALDNAAKEGLLRWRFDPARENGNPVDAYLLLWVTFRE